MFLVTITQSTNQTWLLVDVSVTLPGLSQSVSYSKEISLIVGAFVWMCVHVCLMVSRTQAEQPHICKPRLLPLSYIPALRAHRSKLDFLHAAHQGKPHFLLPSLWPWLTTTTTGTCCPDSLPQLWKGLGAKGYLWQLSFLGDSCLHQGHAVFSRASHLQPWMWKLVWRRPSSSVPGGLWEP